MKMNKWSMISICCAVGSAIFEILKAAASDKRDAEKLDDRIRAVMQEETRERHEKG